MPGKHISIILAAATVILMTAGCIKNDIPYPRKIGKIIAFEVQGQLSEAVIDSTAMTVKVDMADTVLLDRVRLLRLETTSNTTVSPDISAYVDLSRPLVYTLETWPGQSYRWTVTATQTVERYVRVKNQIGEASINVDEHEAVVYVTLGTPLDAVEITDMKLGPSNSVITPDPASVHDFTFPQTFAVSYRDVVEEWTMAVIPREVTLTTEPADAWACSAYLYGMVPDGAEAPGFRYRKASETEWTDVQGVEVDGMRVSAVLTGLEPETEYVYRIYSGEMEGSEKEFVTEAAAQMPNMGFDEWIKDGKSWFANPDLDAGYWWDSGNIGANIIGEANPTSPEESFLAVPGTGKRAARLETVKVVIAMAGGNVFSGHFGSVQGLGAEVFFGRPFETRPLRMTGWYSYEPVPIDNVNPPGRTLQGQYQ